MKQENVTPTEEKGQSTETNPQMTQIMELADKNFKVTILTAQWYKRKYAPNE